MEEEQSEVFEPFRHLSSFAQSLDPLYVSRLRQEKRPSHFELSACDGPRFKRASHFLAWSSVVFEDLDTIYDSFNQFRLSLSHAEVSPAFGEH